MTITKTNLRGGAKVLSANFHDEVDEFVLVLSLEGAPRHLFAADSECKV
jgi:hypothetical protein